MRKAPNRLGSIIALLLVGLVTSVLGNASEVVTKALSLPATPVLDEAYTFRADQPLLRFGYAELMHFAQQRKANQKAHGNAKQVIRVTINGEVVKPGTYTQDSPPHITDLLYRAGGVKPSGSLRHIKVQRDDNEIIFDAYPLLGSPSDTQNDLILRDGDHITVPFIGNTVAVAGEVAKPAIFELQHLGELMVESTETWSELLQLAGGISPPDEKLFLHQSLDALGQTVYFDLAAIASKMRNGDLLLVKPLTTEPAKNQLAVDSILDIESENFLDSSDAAATVTPLAQKNHQVALMGAFHNPGIYSIQAGETLFELVLRAGGLAPNAYPYGAILTRANLRQEAVKQRIHLLQDLRASLSSLQNIRDGSTDAVEITTAILSIQSIIRQIEQTETMGRAVVEADPTVLQVLSELDTVLEDGDILFMPYRPNQMRVVGAVLNPGSFPFTSGKSAEDYIALAGGTTDRADHDRIFAILPNGLTQQLEVSYWNYQPTKLPPGTTLVVSLQETEINDLIPVHDLQSIQDQLFISSAITQLH